MARETVGDVPAVLMSSSEPVWGDPVASRAWFAEQGIEPGHIFHVGPACRRKEAIEGWARANGCARDDLPRLLDFHKVAALGIPGGWSSDAVRERLARVK